MTQEPLIPPPEAEYIEEPDSGTYDALAEIRRRHGHLTPELVLMEATDPAHPLHGRFNWDDTDAARRYRLIQARQLLRITYRPNPERSTDLRAFVAVRGPLEKRADYVPTHEALADPFQRQLVLRQAERDWKALKARYLDLAEFAAIVASNPVATPPPEA